MKGSSSSSSTTNNGRRQVYMFRPGTPFSRVRLYRMVYCSESFRCQYYALPKGLNCISTRRCAYSSTVVAHLFQKLARAPPSVRRHTNYEGTVVRALDKGTYLNVLTGFHTMDRSDRYDLDHLDLNLSLGDAVRDLYSIDPTHEAGVRACRLFGFHLAT